MKKIVITIGLLVVISFAMAQTDFRHITYDEAIVAAKAENKMIFMDFYTVWCGPCAMMAKQVFPQKEVGDYLNARFVCIKLDAEKEGTDLAQRYNVKAFPTFIVIDAEGKELMRKVGSASAQGFLAEMEQQFNPEKSYDRLEARYQSGERTPELIRTYASLQKSKKAARDIVKSYFDGLSDEQRVKEENSFIYMDYTEKLEDEYIRYMIANRDRFTASLKEEIMERVSSMYVDQVAFSGFLKYDRELLENTRKEIEQLGLNADGRYDLMFRFVACRENDDWGRYLDLFEKEYDVMSLDDKRTVTIGMFGLSQASDKDVLEHASRFIRRHFLDMDVTLIFMAVPVLSGIEEKIATL